MLDTSSGEASVGYLKNSTMEAVNSSGDLKITVEEQTKLPMAALITYFVLGAEGVAMILGNGLLIFAILSQKTLRRHEFTVVAGLALGDLIYGWGYFFAGIARFRLALKGAHLSPISRWSCMLTTQTPFFIVGSQAAALMMVVMSADRLLAVRFFSIYMGLSNSYVKKVCGVVFGYCLVTLAGTYMMSYFFTEGLGNIAAICISTQVGPKWFASYQPTLQMGCGILSVLIFCLTWVLHRKRLNQVADQSNRKNKKQNKQRSIQLEKQRKMTKIVGITVIVTFFCYIIPHGIILIANTVGAKSTASFLSPFAWAIGNLNSIVNIFIFGTAIRDLRITLRAYLCLKKPQFNQTIQLNPVKRSTRMFSTTHGENGNEAHCVSHM